MLFNPILCTDKLCWLALLHNLRKMPWGNTADTSFDQLKRVSIGKSIKEASTVTLKCLLRADNEQDESLSPCLNPLHLQLS